MNQKDFVFGHRTLNHLLRMGRCIAMMELPSSGVHKSSDLHDTASQHSQMISLVLFVLWKMVNIKGNCQRDFDVAAHLPFFIAVKDDECLHL